jgi:hypothetical protein
MKKILVALILCFSFASTAHAQALKLQKNIVCDETLIMFQHLKKDHYTPWVISQFKTENLLTTTTVFMNPDKDVAVIETRIMDGKSISCIVGLGEGAQFVDQHGLVPYAGPSVDVSFKI